MSSAIGKIIRENRKKRGWTQQKLAEEAGLCYAIICKIEQGISQEPTINTLIKIADAFDINMDELIGRRRKR